MARAATSPRPDFRKVLLETFAVSERVNQLILDHLDSRAWLARPPGRNARTIAAIFTHMHNVRRKWLRLSAPHLKLPAQITRTQCTQKQARVALAESARRCSEMLEEALSRPEGRVKQFLRDGWAKPWPAGASMVVYMVAHEAHHRGQVCMLAHQLGFRLQVNVMARMWCWESLWTESGFHDPG